MVLFPTTWLSQESDEGTIDRTVDFSQLPDSLHKVEHYHYDGWKYLAPVKPKFPVEKLILKHEAERVERVKRVLWAPDRAIFEGADTQSDTQSDTHPATDTL